MEFKDGFNYAFEPKDCSKCQGKCCTGPSGYIWINDEEIEKLAKFLNISDVELKNKFLFKVGDRFSIKEKIFENGYACVFFNEKTKQCNIYDVRPNQCRTFPFWNYFKKNFKELRDECIGVRSL